MIHETAIPRRDAFDSPGEPKDCVEDLAVIERLKKGDQQTATTFVRKHSRQLLSAALAQGFARDQAEELVQATWEAFFVAVRRFEGRSRLKTFLFGVLFNKCRELRRHHGRFKADGEHDEITDRQFTPEGWWAKEPGSPEHLANCSELRDHLTACIQDLPETQRMAFYLREVVGEDSASICNVLSVTDTNLGVLIFRAKSRLRICLEGKASG